MSFAAYPSVFVYETPDQKKKVQHLIWGDEIELLGPQDGDWVSVRARRDVGWVRKQDLQEQRLLEVNFVDVGQGDGSFIVTPDNQIIMVDAGEQDNMFHFIRWRYNLRKGVAPAPAPQPSLNIQSAIVSHSDADHSLGFAPFFDSPHFHFGTIYHNGVMERAGDDPLGPKVKIGRQSYLADVIADRASLERLLQDPHRVGQKSYLKMLKTASESGRADDLRMLCAADGFLPGYDEHQPLVIRVLGPVTKTGEDGKRLLRWFTDAGKTKNGHSIILKVEYGLVKVMLGGDLNTPAEEHLLEHYTGLSANPRSEPDRQRLINKARETFQVDVSKACHHGSADFADLFLQVINPIATVISSGDDESYCHPRPDALGAVGKNGRGDRPLIFSTELARSTKGNIRGHMVLRGQINRLFVKLGQATSEQEKRQIQDKLAPLLAKIERSVAVYGLINLRTDGRRVLFAQKLERPRPATKEKWDIHTLEPDENGCLRHVLKPGRDTG